MSTTDAPAPKAPPKLGLSTIEFVIIIAGLMSLNALAIDIMLPAMTEIGDSFGLVKENDQQLIVFAYILGFGAPQIVWGPLSDRYGRRPILFLGLIFYAVTGFICMFASSFAMLLGVRFVQGVFASAIRVVAVSIVRDIFEGRGMARIMSMVMTIFMVVPIAAPSIGQLVLYTGPWQWIFGVLAVMSSAMLAWTYLRLPETLPATRRRPISITSAVGAYMQVFQSRVTFGYMAASGVIFGSLFAFIMSAEQVYKEVYHTGDAFVLWFAGVAIMMSASSFTNSRLVERFGMRRLSHASLLAFVTIAISLVIALSVFGETMAVFFIPFAMIFGCFGMIGSNFNAMAMEPLGEIAGTASAAYGFATTTVASLIGWLIASQFNGSSIPIVMGFAGLGLTSLMIVLITERGRLFGN